MIFWRWVLLVIWRSFVANILSWHDDKWFNKSFNMIYVQFVKRDALPNVTHFLKNWWHLMTHREQAVRLHPRVMTLKLCLLRNYRISGNFCADLIFGVFCDLFYIANKWIRRNYNFIIFYKKLLKSQKWLT